SYLNPRNALTQLIAIVILVCGLSAQSICFPSSPTHHTTTDTFVVNVKVTNPNGIMLTYVQFYEIGSNPHNYDLYTRIGPATTAHCLSQSGWVLRESGTLTGIGATWNINDFFLPPGTTGLAIVSHDPSRIQTTDGQLLTVGNSDVSMTAVGAVSDPFQAWPQGKVWSDTHHLCLSYDIATKFSISAASYLSGSPIQSGTLYSSPADLGGSTSGTAGFKHFYNTGQLVTLTAPNTLSNPAAPFHHWVIDGVAQTTGVSRIQVRVNSSIDAEAHYGSLSTVTVRTNRDGVSFSSPITASPADFHGSSGGFAPYTLDYWDGSSFTLTAPIKLSKLGKLGAFQSWTIDGVPYSATSPSLDLQAGKVGVVVAEYATATCYEPSLGTALGMGDESLSTGHALGFDFPLPNGGTTNTIDICSNGYIWWVSGSSSKIDPSP
ncbi:MAG: hypothetical protein GY926_01525, partial [bacterium]|nr:hypothetical protein [bacterium]